jgi:hypothetical protein
MPTHIAVRSGSASIRASDPARALLSDDVTVLLLWTATGLAIAVGLIAFGLQPEITQGLAMFG